MRGQGGVFLRGKTWWIRHSWHGKEYRESAETGDKGKAEKLLLERLKSMNKKPRSSRERRYTLDDMRSRIELEYTRKQNRSFKNVCYCWPHIEEGFQFHRVVDIDKDAIEKYQAARLKAGAKPATINREVAYVKLGIKLLGLPVPLVEQLVENNVRRGFVRIGDFNVLLAGLRDANVRDIVQFQYHSARRPGEPMAMQWSWLDVDEWMVTIPGEFHKNKKPVKIPIEGVLRDIIKRRIALRDAACPFIFHRNGKQIKSFRKAFKAAAKAAGLDGAWPHDTRRSMIRNFRKAGLSENEGMRLSGHQTRAVYDRYDIHDDQDAREAMRRAQDYVRTEAARKVIPLRRKAQ
jgi:integrase